MQFVSRRVVCVLMAIIMILLVTPIASVAEQVVSAQEEAYKMRELKAAWEEFDAVEKDMLQKKATPMETTLALYKAIESSRFVDKESIHWGSDDQILFTVDGMSCVYSYRIRNTYPAASKDFKYRKMLAEKSGEGKNILLIEPFYGVEDMFTDEYFVECEAINQTTGGTVTTLVGPNASGTAIVQNITNKDVVLIHSHGTSADGTAYISLTSSEGVTAADASKGLAMYFGGDRCLINARYIQYYFQGRLSNSFIWTSSCSAMNYDTSGDIGTIFLSLGAACVLGYSGTVSVTYDRECLQAFWREMQNGATVAEAAATMKEEVGAYDPYYYAY
ncbi:MAG: hypothetical protein IKX16_07110, partial [Clostridia bacterium]|nr:hypothetical protein [Clostridia bacterium]